MTRDYWAKARFVSEYGVEIEPTCGDCGVLPGENHLGMARGIACDTMICPVCRRQRLLPCDHEFGAYEWTYAYSRDLFRLKRVAVGP